MAKKYKNTYLPSYYNTSSNAYDYDLGLYEYENERIRKEKLKRAELEAENVKRKSFVHRIKFTAAIFLVFSGCIVTMSANAAVDRQRVANNSLKDQLSKLKNENVNLQSEISKNTDLAYIENEAKTRLGMSEPQPYQIVYIDVPKQSYTVQYEAETEEKDSDFGFKGFISVLKDIAGINN